jgi:hypothetical protein
LRFESQREWEVGVETFEDRLRGRFFSIVSRFLDEPFAGFAVLALDCLLIETLEQFRRGEKNTPNQKGEQYFIAFLTRSPFAPDFDDNTARLFYKQFRNGILHQAEIEPPSLVKRGPQWPLVKQLETNGLIVNRDLFHERLESAFEQYVLSLRNDWGSELRVNFRKKMDFICAEPSTE